MPHDFCIRFVIVFYANVLELKMSCYILIFKHFHYENGFIVVTLWKGKVLCREKVESLRKARNVFREPARGEQKA